MFRFFYFLIIFPFVLFCGNPSLNNAADPGTLDYSISRFLSDLFRPILPPPATPASSSPTEAATTATTEAAPRVACEDTGSWTYSYPTAQVGVITIPRFVEDSTGNIYLLTMGNENPGNPTNFNGTNQPILIKLNSKGTIQWSYFLGTTGTSEDRVGDLILTDNGVLVAVTVTDSINGGGAQGAFQGTMGSTSNVGVFEISSTGTLLRGRYLGNSSGTTRSVSLIRNGSNEYIILVRVNNSAFLPANIGVAKSLPTVNSANDTAVIVSLNSNLVANWHTVFGAGGFNQTPFLIFRSPISGNIWVFGVGFGDPDNVTYNNADQAHPGNPGQRHFYLAGFDSNGNYLRHRYMGLNSIAVNDSPVYRGTQIGDSGFIGAMHTGSYLTSPTPVRSYVGPNREHTSFSFSLTNGAINFNTFHGREQLGYFGGMWNTGLGRAVISMTKEIDPGVGVAYPGGRSEYVAQMDTSGSITKHTFLPIGSNSYNFNLLGACDGSLLYGEIEYDDKAAPTLFQTKLQKLSRSAFPIPRPYRKSDGTIEYREE